MHYSAPSHPLIHGFLLRTGEFQDAGKLIVEDEARGEKLLKVLQGLEKIKPTGHEFRLIRTPADTLEVEFDPSIVGIYPLTALAWKVDEKDIETYCLLLKKNMSYNEEKLISWLSDRGYIARKSDELGTYFRVGDTISIPTKKGMARVSFFGTKIEEIFLGDETQEMLRIFRI